MGESNTYPETSISNGAAIWSLDDWVDEDMFDPKSTNGLHTGSMGLSGGTSKSLVWRNESSTVCQFEPDLWKHCRSRKCFKHKWRPQWAHRMKAYLSHPSTAHFASLLNPKLISSTLRSGLLVICVLSNFRSVLCQAHIIISAYAGTPNWSRMRDWILIIPCREFTSRIVPSDHASSSIRFQSFLYWRLKPTSRGWRRSVVPRRRKIKKGHGRR